MRWPLRRRRPAPDRQPQRPLAQWRLLPEMPAPPETPILAPLLSLPDVVGTRPLLRADGIAVSGEVALTVRTRPLTARFRVLGAAELPWPAGRRSSTPAADVVESTSMADVVEPAPMDDVVESTPVALPAQAPRRVAAVAVDRPAHSLVEAGPESVGEAVVPEAPFQGVSTFDRLVAQYEGMGLDQALGLMGISGLVGGTSIAELPGPDTAPAEPPGVPRAPRRTLGQSRRLGLGPPLPVERPPVEPREPHPPDPEAPGGARPVTTAPGALHDRSRPAPRELAVPGTRDLPGTESSVVPSGPGGEHQAVLPDVSAAPPAMRGSFDVDRRVGPRDGPGADVSDLKLPAAKGVVTPVAAQVSSPPVPAVSEAARPAVLEGSASGRPTVPVPAFPPVPEGVAPDGRSPGPVEAVREFPAVPEGVASGRPRAPEGVVPGLGSAGHRPVESGGRRSPASSPDPVARAGVAPLAQEGLDPLGPAAPDSPTPADPTDAEPRRSAEALPDHAATPLAPEPTTGSPPRLLTTPAPASHPHSAPTDSPLAAHPGQVLAPLTTGSTPSPVYRAVLPVAALPPRPPAPVPAELVSAFRRRFGVDVGGVALHRGPVVTRQAARLGARAYTSAGDVHLPDDTGPLHHPRARALLAHELVHAVQQRSYGTALPPEDSPTGRALEAEAATVEHWFRDGGDTPAPLPHAQQATPPSATQRAASGTPAPGTPPPASTWTPETGFRDGPPPEPPVPPAPPEVAEGLSDVFHQLATLHAALADLRARPFPESGPLLDDDITMDRLAARLYGPLRTRLRGELLIDRERSGTLADPR